MEVAGWEAKLYQAGTRGHENRKNETKSTLEEDMSEARRSKGSH